MKTTVIKSVFQFRRAASDEWESVNPILRVGEPGYDITNKKHKIGDGVTAWNELSYQEGSGSVSGNINWDQIINAPTKLSDFENDLEIPDTSYIDGKLAYKADINHNHDGVYQPIGDYLTEETDPTVPDWAKQSKKPVYTYDEIEGTPDLAQYATTNYVDGELERTRQEFENNEYVTETELNEKGFLTEHQSLEDYAKKSDIPTQPDLSPYALKSEIPDVSGFITDTELEAKGYLTEHQSLDGLATVAELEVKQDKLTAGAGILIKDNIISATGGGTGFSGVESINEKTGVVTLTASDIITSSSDVNKVSVVSNGTLEVNGITFDRIEQAETDEIVISGGNA